jgi:hypothetical protein
MLHVVISDAPGGGHRASCEGDGLRVLGQVRLDEEDAASEAVRCWRAEYQRRERRREDETRRLG